MSKSKTPAHVTKAIAAVRSAWQTNKAATSLVRIVLNWYKLALKRGVVPNADVLLFVGEVADRLLAADEDLVAGQNSVNDHGRQIPKTAIAVLNRLNQV